MPVERNGHGNPPETGPTTLYEPSIPTSWELYRGGARRAREDRPPNAQRIPDGASGC